MLRRREPVGPAFLMCGGVPVQCNHLHWLCMLVHFLNFLINEEVNFVLHMVNRVTIFNVVTFFCHSITI